MSDPNTSDDLPFLDDLPVTPIPEQKPEQTPSPGAPGKTEPVETAKGKPEAPLPDAESTRPAAPQAPAPPVSAPKPEKQPAPPVEPQRPPAPPVEPRSHPALLEEPERKRAVIPPAILARRMQRYSIYLILLAFLLVGVNYDALTPSAVLWFAAGLTAGFAILCAVAVVLLNAIAWNFDRLRDELRGGREVVDLRE